MASSAPGPGPAPTAIPRPKIGAGGTGGGTIRRSHFASVTSRPTATPRRPHPPPLGVEPISAADLRAEQEQEQEIVEEMMVGWGSVDQLR